MVDTDPTTATSRADPYYTLVDHLTDAVYVVRDFRFDFVNRRFEELFGYSREEVCALDFDYMRLVAPESRPLIAERARKRQRREEVDSTYSFRALNRNGDRFEVEVTTVSLGAPEELFVAGIVRDLTRERQVEARAERREQELWVIARAIRDAIVLIDDSGRVSLWNPAAERMFGYSADEVIGEDLHLLLAPKEMHETYRKGIARFARTGTGPAVGKLVEFTAVKKDGTRFPVEVSTSAVRLAGHWCAAGIIRDITERKRLRESLEKRERFLSDLFQSIQDGISVLDKEFTIVQVNPVMEKWYAHAMPLVGRKCWEAYHGRSEPCEVCPSRTALEKQEAAREVVPMTGPDKKARGWISLYSFPLFDSATGEMTGVLEYARDITEQKRAEDALRELNKELEQRVVQRTAELENLVAAMSGREVRMAELKQAVKELRQQLVEAGLTPVTDDPLAAWRKT